MKNKKIKKPKSKKIIYVVFDTKDEQFYTTTTPDDSDEIIFETTSQFEADCRLGRELSRCD